MKEGKAKTLGAVSVSEKRRELDFKAGLKKIFPDAKIRFTYSDIKFKGKPTEELKSEGAFGYHKRESILVDGMPIKIAWLPHIKDMPPIYIEMITARVIEEVAKVVDVGSGNTDILSVDCRKPV